MKLKVLALSAALIAGVFSANAQTEKQGKDIFLGAGVGVNTTLYKQNAPAIYGNIQFGKYVTPVWGVRAVVGVGKSNLVEGNQSAYIDAAATQRYTANQLFGELSLDGILNISNIFADDLAKFDVYLFAGPVANLSKTGTKFQNAVAQNESTYILVEKNDDLKVRVGANVGLGLAYNITPAFALGVEARTGLTPSIFGDADAYRKASPTGRLTLNGVWTIGGKNGKLARAVAAAAAAGYISPEAAKAIADEAVAKNPKIVEKIVEKEVIKYVDKLVKSEVPSSTAIFFAINKSTLEAKDKARVQLLAEAIINGDKDAVYEVGGYADKKTGSAKTNQRISEKRAQTVYDALIAAGVPASKLEKKAYGGVDAMFFGNDILSRTVVIKQK